jgi:hypothetical protein
MKDSAALSMTKSGNNTNNNTNKSSSLNIGSTMAVCKIEPSKRHLSKIHPKQNNYSNLLRREKLKPNSTAMSTTTTSTSTSTSASANTTNTFESYTISRQMDKKQRFDIFIKRMSIKPCVSNSNEAIELMNRTITEIEDKYAPRKNNKFYAINSKRYGRMHPIPKERIKLNPDTGITELLSVGLITYIHPNGYIEMWTLPRGKREPQRIFKKKALVPVSSSTTNTTSDSSS